ncbi:MAG: B12-binding domain-containing radical SAM protein [Candidatus Helarchaeota archaeon]|nr:B12-binding domain-containing radical SAM protein [Candidatus Helarchaeota archaeon]
MNKIKNVKFIIPDQNRFCANFSTVQAKGLRLPHLGLLIIGEMLRREKGCSVEVFEEKIKPVSISDIEGADIVGISIQTVAAIRGYQLAEQIKKQFKIPVVLGGVHATLKTNEALEHANYVVRNEGEYTFLELVEALESNISPDDIAGLSFKHGGEVYHNPMRPFIDDLDSLPFPNWKLIKGMFKTNATALNHFLYPMQVSRGCPFNCTFCSVTPTFGKKYRYRSIESVIEELKTNRKKTQQDIFLYDDNIAGNKRYLKELLSALIENDVVPRSWHSQMRADVAEDDELIDLMKRTNCSIATFGFESINPDSLKEMKKGQTVDLIEHCIATMHKNNIFVAGFFVFGFETDTKATIRETVEFAREKKIDIIGLMPLTPYPSTPRFEEMKDKIFSKYWELYDVQHVVYYPEQMTPSELYFEALDGYPRFYDPKGREYFKVDKSKPGYLPHHSFLERTVQIWAKQTRNLYELELIANERYIEWLRSLPEKSELEKIEHFTIEKEDLDLHKELKRERRKLKR